jgi:DNA-binding transcriptional LysR family regulator
MISFQAYQAFYAVAQCGSITAAAKLLELTQPTVSHAIQMLEQALACPLFVRTRKGVSLTPEGQRLYEDIAPACRRIRKAEADFQSRQSLEEGQIYLGASEITLRHFLLPYLKEFRQTYPAIRLRLSNSTTPAALEALHNGELDCAVLVIDPRENYSDLRVIPLAVFRDMVIAGPGFARLRERTVSLAHLMEYPLIAMTEGTVSRSFFSGFFAQHGLALTPEIETATADLITPLVETGLGIGFVPPSFAAESIQAGKIFPVQLEEAVPCRHICMVQPEKRPISTAAQAFVEMFRHSS